MGRFEAPGVFIEEIVLPRTIEAVPTSTTAFVGTASDGPIDQPTKVTSFGDFEDTFGGLSHDAPLSYAVSQFFANEGGTALVVRVEDARQVAEPGHGIHALGPTDDFELLVMPPFAMDIDVPVATWAEAARVCRERRVIVLVDAPASWRPGDIEAALATWDLPRENAALYYPRLLVADPLDGGRPAAFAPSGAVAGVIARLDRDRGLWRAPAGTFASVRGVAGLDRALSEDESGRLNRGGLNTLREFPGQGVVIWGARTLAGQDGQAPEWKYLNVRRLLLFIERSIDEGIRWAAFEPNAEPLWAKLRQTIGNFLTVLWRDGAFPGTRQEDAFFVKVDRSTMTQNDIDDGILNVLVGVAPVRAAEFVILRFGQRAVQPDP